MSTHSIWIHTYNDKEKEILCKIFLGKRANCAASVEYLCSLFHLPCPQWAYDPSYILAVPWWNILRLDDREEQERFRNLPRHHYLLRWYLWRNRRILWDLVAFLNEATNPARLPLESMGEL